ncbi:signal peptidase I [Haloarcula sp. Atlit-7R]|uniref:signal peptidase I n=1 Tax=Haloarcula sp. Atlit-7R TaxID=2282125 RepID=UPI000EF13112|nr:signal peptidase I [Haloarcula sp. Atlit-7R]RLM88244.1 signal peptidase I [Haloarcula sp. Atlit-7R]
MLRQAVEDAFTLLAVLVVLSLVIGQLLGQPILLGYVTSGSMSPTLNTGDAFVAVPAPVAGEIEPGDVIVFEAVELQGGGLTTHRVVAETEAGYITKGDNNPFRDQSGGEPVVTDDRVVATALQVNGQVVRLPGLGTAISSARTAAESGLVLVGGASNSDLTSGQGLSGLFISIGLGLFLLVFVDSFRASEGQTRDRTRSRDGDAINGWTIILALAVLILVPANAAMVAPSGTHSVTIDSASEEVTPGEPVESEFTAENGGLVTMLIVLKSPHPNATMDRNRLVVQRGGSATATLSVTAPPPGERAVVTVEEHRYFLLAPPGVIAGLHRVHPLVAIGAFNFLVLGSLAAAVGATFGFGTTRKRSRDRSVPLKRQIRRLLGRE